MPGTNIVAAKKALIERLAALLAVVPGMEEVQVAYTWPGRDPERECVYGGPGNGDQRPVTFQPTGGRIQRDEQVTVTIHIEVCRPDGDAVAGDQRAAELGTVLEEDLAANPTMAGAVSRLLHIFVASVDLLEPSVDDDGVTCGIDYDIGFRSYLN